MFVRSVATIVCSSYYSASITHEGGVSSCGTSSLGQHGHHEEQVCPSKKITALQNIVSISVGSHCACVDIDGNVFTFGSNDRGQLGIGIDKDTLRYTHIPQKVSLPRCSQVSCGYFFTICLSEEDCYILLVTLFWTIQKI